MNETDANSVTTPALQVCANCQTPGTGRYCGNCGQRLDTHIHSVWHFAGEATEVLTHADSRVWNTLVPLLIRPGFLSREFFAGRRARYLQPFRLYVVLSVIFLLLASWLSDGPHAVQIETGKVDAHSCNDIQTELPGVHLLRPRLIGACRKLAAEGAHELMENIAHNLGRAMFVFLPLMALFMKLLYWKPRRYYLEHLLLLLHNHAFVFLWLSIYLLIMHWLHASGWQTLLGVALIVYLIRYLYRSMKVFYAQSGALTFAKFTALLFLYAACASIMLFATTIISAVTL